MLRSTFNTLPWIPWHGNVVLRQTPFKSQQILHNTAPSFYINMSVQGTAK